MLIHRLLVFRDGVSDGSFDKVDNEIAAIREAMKLKSDVPCKCNRGCKVCCPPITFVVCQSQHSVRVVPCQDSDGFQGRNHRGGVNVHRYVCLSFSRGVSNRSSGISHFAVSHSGTVVDDRLILELGTLLTISDDDVSAIQALNDTRKQVLGASDDSYDFLLTAQGGLKGTSKPIYYRVRL